MPFLQDDLSSKAVRVASVPVNGRYHNRNNDRYLQSLLELCSTDPFGPFWVPWAQDKLEHCLRSILTEPASWFSDMKKVITSFTPTGTQMPITTLELGLVSCIPPSLVALPHHHIIRGSLSSSIHPFNYPDTSIAIIGAACKYPGANSLSQLWDIIATGQVMYGEAPPGRFGKETVTGNFLSDANQFDHVLFGISPREAMYMDPQQRIALQVAYQAVESSGYFGSPNPDGDVGCYIGVGNSDYEYNIQSNTPTAYSFTGTSRAFISGRISHHFKWTGPSITVDTACSSSAAAIHQACSGILLGDCSVALAGGVNIMSSLPAEQSIAAAGMTNSTAPCRPFDAAAAGYSRGEGCGFIVLKRLSDALSQGDNVLGVIVATATNQSDGSSSITVPVLRSQSDLYRRVLSRAAMSASDVSYVEAHGTGTQRGDPVEYQSAREVFGSVKHQANSHKVYVGSVKANIGHTEAASGVAGVLKVLLMLKNGQIPPQASFTSLNPAIPPSESSQISISRRLQQWKGDFRAACVNNYGAAGNNTAIVICQHPPKARPSFTNTTKTLTRYPFLISTQSQASLRRYCLALAHYIETRSGYLSLADVSSLVSQQQNRSLRHRIAFGASSLPELQVLLRSHTQAAKNTFAPLPPSSRKQEKPIILVFGGQTGSTLRFNKAVYDSSYYLRQNMDECNAVIQRIGLPGLFPNIFSREPIEDIVMLHGCLFSVQYACAKAWLDSGLSIHRVIGHSFGQLTAMCISGVITLEDALRLVVGRAKLIRDCWGDEKGSMLSVEVDRAGAEALAWSESNLGDDSIEVACYNGPNSHVLVGSELAIANVEKRASTASLATRRLKTTHGFHSKLVDPIMAQYLDLAHTVSYHAPVIPIETCSETAPWKKFTSQLVAEHSRKPVYFCDAVRRIERDLGPCTWLEAGSGSGAVILVKKSLTSKLNHLCGPQLGSSNTNPLDSVVDTTVELWNQGSSVQFWAYHPQNLVYSSNLLDLPGYQFDTSPHWLPYSTTESTKGKGPSLETGGLVSLARLSRPEPHVSKFELDQRDWILAYVLRGREVLGGTLWPLALYMEVVARAASLLTSSNPSTSRHIRFVGFEIKTPLGADLLNGLCLRMKKVETWSWEFSLESDCAQHAIGTVTVSNEHARTFPYHPSSLPYFAATTAVFSAPSSVAYKLFDKVAEYDPAYRGLESISIKEDSAIARVHTPPAAGNTSSAGRAITLDQFLVVAEIHALSMEESKRSELFACSGFGEATISASFTGATGGRNHGQIWQVYTRQSAKRGREIFYDIFVYEAGEDEGEESGLMILTLTGARFIRTSTSTLQQIVELANAAPRPHGAEDTATSPGSLQLQEAPANIWSLTLNLLHELTGCAPEHISPQTVLADMGMDSLAFMEIEARIRNVFNVDIRINLSDMGNTVETICERIAAQTSPGPSHGLVNIVDNSTSNATSSPSQCTPSSSSESDSETRETQATEMSLSDPTMEKVARIVATHVGSGETVLSNSRLHGLGLDSLAVLELQSDLHVNFGLRIHLMQLDCATTVGDLHALVMRRGVREDI